MQFLSCRMDPNIISSKEGWIQDLRRGGGAQSACVEGRLYACVLRVGKLQCPLIIHFLLKENNTSL